MNDIKSLLLKFRNHLIVAISAILVIISIINIYYVLEIRVTSNDECLWLSKKDSTGTAKLFFDLVKENGVTWNAGIRNGDQLISINNEKLKDQFHAQSILNLFNSGEYAPYTFIRDGKEYHTTVYVKKLIQFGSLAASIQGLILILIAFVVLLAKPDGTIQKLFYAIGAATVFAGMNIIIQDDIFFQTQNSNPFGMAFVGYLWCLGASFIPFLTIYFFWMFPLPFKFLEQRFLKIFLFAAPSVIFLTIFVLGLLSFSGTRETLNAFYLSINIIGGLVIVANIIGYVSLIINYRRLKTSAEKKPVFIIIAALTLGLFASAYTAWIAPAITDTIFNSPEFYMPVILVTIVPIAFGYSIFRYQLMDVSVVIKNTVVYGAATLTVAAIYFFVIYVIGQSISKVIGTDYQGLIAGIIFIIFALVFQSTKDRFQDFLTSKFYPEQFAYQKVLLRFSNEVSTVVGLENILDAMKETFVEALKINRFGLLLKELGTDTFRLARHKGLTVDEFKINSTFLEHYLKEKENTSQRLVIEQNEFDLFFPEQSKVLKDQQIFTVIPMILKSRVVGLLLFGLKHSGSQFAGKDLDLLNAAAAQSAIALENARLYESEAEKIKLERDLDLARKIQQGLLPQCIPFLNGLDICGEMIPAMQVGGDYFDLIPLSDKKVFIVVGDVSGKGLSASLYMTKLQTMIQLSCVEGKSPKDILIEVNQKIYATMERNWFVTMTLALFDVEKRTLKFCRAGHVPLLKAMNGTVNSFRTQGIGVGLEKGEVFSKTLTEENVTLQEGQIYAFFSDGIVEAMNEKNDLFGEDKLTELLRHKTDKRSSEIMKDIWNSLGVFRGSAEQNDDMTMVIVKILETSDSSVHHIS
ncbi:MAG: SpoIIE family protein phosphatase [Ignavibacteriales bacterium]|nr:MAG: SpoIIE family protein phosphatase [Ignavibacteriales bacterium]